MAKKSLDEIDWRILATLQENARVSNVELAGAVGISPSPCWRRVRELEESGVIARYVTLVAIAAYQTSPTWPNRLAQSKSVALC